MKIAFFNSHNIWIPHTETELEIIQRHLDEGDKVVQMVCNADLPVCDVNNPHDLKTCLKCIGKRQHGQEFLTEKITQIPFLKLNSSDKKEIQKLPKTFDSIADLQNFYFEDFDIGYAVCSSLVSFVRDPSPNLQLHKNLVYRYLTSALAVYFSILNYLKENKTDRFYIFNGRFAQVKAVLRACQKMNVECVVHERGHNFKHYQLIYNTIPHDFKYIENKIIETWKNAPENKIEIAEKYYLDRAKGKAQHWKAFAKNQEPDLLPSNWNSEKENIVIYCSSEDEFVSISQDFKNPIYENQIDGIEKITETLKDEKEMQIYVRLHPNMAEVENENKNRYLKLQQKNLTLIDSDSKISSYALLHACDKVLTFGSILGIEATFWGKASILAGIIFYRNLGGTYNPKSHEELINLLKQKPEPKPKETAYPYAYYQNTYGIPYKYYQPESLFEGKYKGTKLTSHLNKKQKLAQKILGFWILKPLLPYFNYLHKISRMKRFF